MTAVDAASVQSAPLTDELTDHTPHGLDGDHCTQAFKMSPERQCLLWGDLSREVFPGDHTSG